MLRAMRDVDTQRLNAAPGVQHCFEGVCLTTVIPRPPARVEGGSEQRPVAPIPRLQLSVPNRAKLLFSNFGCEICDHNI